MSLTNDLAFELEIQEAQGKGYFITADFDDSLVYRNKPSKNRRDRKARRDMKRQGFIY